MSQPPKTFFWVGSSKENQYWSDPDNWKGAEVPNQQDAIAVFSKSLDKDTTIYLQEDVHLGKMWVSEKHTITFDSEESGEEAPNFYLETSNQFSPIFIDIENAGDVVMQRHIFHSCYFGQTDRRLGLGRPLPDGVRVTTVKLNGKVSNYKDPERASLQVFGHLNFELNAQNDFKGPVVAKDNGKILAMVNGAIPDGSPLALANGGELYVNKGVTVRVSELLVDGEKIPAGLYVSESISTDNLADLEKSARKGHALTKLGGLSGTGLLQVN